MWQLPTRTLSAGAAVAAALLFGGAFNSALSETVKIAGNMPLTGPMASFSGNYFKAFQMGLDDACKVNKVDCSQFKLDAQDNAGEATQAVTVMQKQLLDDPTVVISGVSAQSQAVLPIVDKLGIPHFVESFDPFIVPEGKSNRLRTLPNYKVQAPLYFRIVDKLKPKRVFALTLNWASLNTEFSVLIEPEMKKRNIAFAKEPFNIDAKEFDNLVLKAKAFNPDFYIIDGFSFLMYPIMKAMAKYGIDPTKVMLDLDFIDLLYSDTPIDELKGYYFASPLYEVPGATTGAESLRARFKDQYKQALSYVPAYAYDTAGIIVAAQTKFGKVTKETLIKSTPYTGVTGDVKLDENGDLVDTVTVAQITKNGKIVEVK